MVTDPRVQDPAESPVNEGAGTRKAAASPPASPAKTAAMDDKTRKRMVDALNCEFMGTLRNIRAEIQNLRISLARIKEAGTSTKIDEREKNFQIAWEENEKIIKKNLGPITALFRKFPDMIYKKDPGGPRIYDWYCDDVTQIDNQWERFLNLWQRYGETKEDILSRIDELDAILCDMIYRINRLTIPDRINEHFLTLYPGQELDFQDNFGDELCRKEDALPLLQSIKSHPQCITGVVDITKGKIYKVDPRLSRRSISIAVAVILCIAGFVVALFLPKWLSLAKYPLVVAIPNTTLANIPTTSIDFSSASLADPNMVGYIFCSCFVLIVAGGLAHLLIGGLKQARSAEAGRLLAVEDWIHWFHIKEQQNWAVAISFFIGFAGLIFILRTADFATAFFVGYSVDSFVDLFLVRFDATVTSKTAEIKKLIPEDKTESAT